jgi:hypothetical protein
MTDENTTVMIWKLVTKFSCFNISKGFFNKCSHAEEFKILIHVQLNHQLSWTAHQCGMELFMSICSGS